MLDADGTDPPGWRWGGNRVKHPASITYRKLGLPVVVATSFAKQAFTWVLEILRLDSNRQPSGQELTQVVGLAGSSCR